MGLQPFEDFAAPAEARVRLENQRDDLRGRLVWRGARRPTLVLQAAAAESAVALPPLVARVAADAVPGAEFGHGPLATLEVLREVVAFEHGIGLLPGHGVSSHRVRAKCHPCPRTSVNHVPRLYPWDA